MSATHRPSVMLVGYCCAIFLSHMLHKGVLGMRHDGWNAQLSGFSELRWFIGSCEETTEGWIVSSERS